MGVDAQMWVKIKGKANAKKVKEISTEMTAAFDPERFFIQKEKTTWSKPHHALEIVKKGCQDGDDIVPEKDESLIEVHLRTRYYGRDYERGDAIFIIALADWLEKKFTESTILYGGDSSGICAEEFGKKKREELWNYFCEVNRTPYLVGRSILGHGLSRTCDFCERPMLQYGFGGINKFRCRSCGLKEQTDDKGKTWTDITKEKE